MPIKTEIDELRRLKTVVFEGRITLSEFIEYRNTIVPDSMRNYDVCYADLSRITNFEFGFDAIMPHANRVSKLSNARGRFTEIILATNDLGFGFARMYEQLIGSDVDLRLFRDEAAAKAALQAALSTLDASS
ncbi:MAG: hypothetical protein AAF497_04135 [Planctomycetota bacterium]